LRFGFSKLSSTFQKNRRSDLVARKRDGFEICEEARDAFLRPSLFLSEALKKRRVSNTAHNLFIFNDLG
jgi:hypothetical protein